MHDDRVLARIVGYDRRGRPEGHIVEVTDRANKRVIGRLLNENGAPIVAPEDKRIGQDILIAQNTKKAKFGQVVVVELTDFPTVIRSRSAAWSEVLGDIDDPGMEIEIAVRKYGVPHEFSQSALDEAARLPDEVPSGRRASIASICATCRSSRSTVKMPATSTTQSIASRFRSAGRRLPPDRRDRRRHRTTCIRRAVSTPMR